MDNEIKFLPRGRTAVLTYAAQVNSVLAEPGFNPAMLKLTATDVAELASVLAEEQALVSSTSAAISQARSNTKALSGRNGVHVRLVAKLRVIANSSRASLAPSAVLASIGVSRKTMNPSPRPVPMEAPIISVDAAQPGFLRVRFSEMGSAQPRARAANTVAVQLAVVDASNPKVDGEADTVPYVTITRSPQNVNSTQMPARGRLYGRWIGTRGQVSAWSAPLMISVV